MPTVQRRGSERVALLTFQTLPSIATGESCVRDLSSQSEHQVRPTLDTENSGTLVSGANAERCDGQRVRNCCVDGSPFGQFSVNDLQFLLRSCLVPSVIDVQRRFEFLSCGVSPPTSSLRPDSARV